jgi:single-strand DNA-binding protein
MSSLNVVLLMGHMTADVELRNAGTTVVANLRMAVNDSYVSKDGKRTEQMVFVDVEVWGKQAESCQKYLSKGSPLMIEGKLKLDQWQTKDGEKRSKLSVRADRVQFLGSKPLGDGEGDPRSRRAFEPGSEGRSGPPAGKGRPTGRGGERSSETSRTHESVDDLSFP